MRSGHLAVLATANTHFLRGMDPKVGGGGSASGGAAQGSCRCLRQPTRTSRAGSTAERTAGVSVVLGVCGVLASGAEPGHQGTAGEHAVPALGTECVIRLYKAAAVSSPLYGMVLRR